MVSDDEEDARVLKRRVVKEYEEIERSAWPGISEGFVRMRTTGSGKESEVARVGADTTSDERDVGNVDAA